jgi:hypothetical protein
MVWIEGLRSELEARIRIDRPVLITIEITKAPSYCEKIGKYLMGLIFLKCSDSTTLAPEPAARIRQYSQLGVSPTFEPF